MPRWVKCLVNRPKIRPSFTLLELIVVMSVVVILAGVSVYQFRNGQTKQDLRTAADELTAMWQEMQTRALAGADVPPDTPFFEISGPYGPLYGRSTTQGYGLLMFGPYLVLDMYFQPLKQMGMVTTEMESGDWQGKGYLSLVGCAAPNPPYLEEKNSPWLQYSDQYDSAWRNFNVYKSVCFLPLKQYLPVLPSGIVIKPESISLGKNATSLHQIFRSYSYGEGQVWMAMPLIKYEDCSPVMGGEIIDVPLPMTTSIFIAIDPPRPTYYVNGRQGCKIVQFALTSLNNPSIELWVRLDLNTGRISYYDNEPT